MKSKSKVIVAVLCIVVVFLVWFGWNQIKASKTSLVQNKVTMFMNDGLQSMVLTAPRILVHSGQTGESYYVSDTNNLNNLSRTSYAVYTGLLYDLNRDLSSPMVKVTNVSLDSDLTTVIDATAGVKFEYFLGFTKTIVVKSSIPEPHFKHATGLELTNGKSY